MVRQFKLGYDLLFHEPRMTLTYINMPQNRVFCTAVSKWIENVIWDSLI